MTKSTIRTDMNLDPCSPTNSILEADLELAAKHEIIQRLNIMETPEGFFLMVTFYKGDKALERYKDQGLSEQFFVIAQLIGTPGKVWYLTTRRDRSMPKMFKDLNRLNEHLKEQYPTASFELYRNCQIPGVSTASGSDLAEQALTAAKESMTGGRSGSIAHATSGNSH